MSASPRGGAPMGNLFAELKRRHIYRVAAAYAVVAWVLLQLVRQCGADPRPAAVDRAHGPAAARHRLSHRSDFCLGAPARARRAARSRA